MARSAATRLPAMAAALKITAPWAVPRSPTNAASGSGGGVYNDDASGATTELENTLLARNGVNCAGTIGELVSPGNNLDTGTACAFAGIGDQTNVGDANVGLGTLAANGGPSQGSSTFSASVVTHPDAHAHQRGGRCSGRNLPLLRHRRARRLPPAGRQQGRNRGRDIGAFELTQQCPTSFEGFGNVTLCAAGDFAVLELQDNTFNMSGPKMGVDGNVGIGPEATGTMDPVPKSNGQNRGIISRWAAGLKVGPPAKGRRSRRPAHGAWQQGLSSLGASSRPNRSGEEGGGGTGGCERSPCVGAFLIVGTRTNERKPEWARSIRVDAYCGDRGARPGFLQRGHVRNTPPLPGPTNRLGHCASSVLSSRWQSWTSTDGRCRTTTNWHATHRTQRSDPR